MSEQAFSTLIDMVKQNGGTDADIYMVDKTAVNVTYRLGKVEEVEREEKTGIGIRVFVGQKQAAVSTYDLSPDHLAYMIGQCLDMAKAAPENPYAGLPDKMQMARITPALGTFDPVQPEMEDMIERAKICEDAARAIDGVTNSEGASAWWSSSYYTYANSRGFHREHGRTSHGTSISVLAGEGTKMERDYDYASATHLDDLDNAKGIGERAAHKAVLRLNPKSPDTGKMPLMFAPRVGKALISDFLNAINGAAVAKGASWAKDLMEKQIFPENVNIIDAAHQFRGLRSQSFDAEGIPSNDIDLIENGILKSWLLDHASAQKLGLESNGRASRSLASNPSPSFTNVRVRPGDASPADLLSSMKKGIYITDMMGFGANTVTGDISQGAAGFMVENGKMVYPVSGFTIAGNIKDMFMNMILGNDLEYRYGVDTPSFIIENMTIAGK